jgi:hypothetical protein
MDINEVKIIALSTFFKLVELIKRDNCYNYTMQISTSYNTRVYIGFCAIINTNRVIIHEEYDLHPKLDNNRLISNDFLIEYIKNMDNITFIGLRESSDPDENLVEYYGK